MKTLAVRPEAQIDADKDDLDELLYLCFNKNRKVRILKLDCKLSFNFIFCLEEDDTSQQQDRRDPDNLQRLRRHVIAFGAAEVYRNRGGRVQMEGLRWNRFYVGGGRRRVGDDQLSVSDLVFHAKNRLAAIAALVRQYRFAYCCLRISVIVDCKQYLFSQEQESPDSNAVTANNREEADVETLKSTVAKDQETYSDDELAPGNGNKTMDEMSSDASKKEISDLIDQVNQFQPQNGDSHVDAVAALETNDDENQENDQLLALEYDDPSQRSPNDRVVDITDGSKRSRSESDAAESETRRKRAASFPWRNGGVGGPLCDDGGSDVDDENEIYKEEQKNLRLKNTRMQREFSRQMKEKILILPLPEALKNYLNYYRN